MTPKPSYATYYIPGKSMVGLENIIDWSWFSSTNPNEQQTDRKCTGTHTPTTSKSIHSENFKNRLITTTTNKIHGGEIIVVEANSSYKCGHHLHDGIDTVNWKYTMIPL